MTVLLHVWHEGAGAGMLLLVLTIASTTALVGLHVWLLRMSGGASPAPPREIRTEPRAIDELRALRRHRAVSRAAPGAVRDEDTGWPGDGFGGGQA